MPKLRTLMDIALGYGARAEDRSGPRYRQPSATLAYGPHPLQALDLHRADDGVRPLIAFLHGGAWQFGDKARQLQDLKIPFAHGEGWHFAALNFRMVPEVGVAEMAGDVAAGLALLFDRADELGIDRRRIVLMGHSSGAHLAAMVASDPALLGAHGLAPADLAGVIANDGAAYDAREPSTGSRLLAKRLLDPAFAGADPKTLSPALRFDPECRYPPFLILHARRRHARKQAGKLERAVLRAGATAERHGFDGAGALAHVRLSRQFGRAGFGPTEVARRWLRRVLAD